jgi:hypothetical protein
LRWWRELQKRPRDLPSVAEGRATDPGSIEAMMLRKGWFHGRAAAPAA